MNKKLKRQIDGWTEAGEHLDVINTLEKFSPKDRDFEMTGLLARAYNNIGEYEKALKLLESTQEEGEQNTNWNFRMGYALYYLNRNKEALFHFKKTNELTPGDEDTLDFIRYCNAELPFRKRVTDFWQWFLDNETELSNMVKTPEEHGSDAIVEFIRQGTDLLSESVHFNIGGDYEFTFSVEGNTELFYLYPYLISRMPEQLKGKWHFFPFNQGTDNSFGFKMYGTTVNMADVHIAVSYREEQNDFGISFYEKNLCSLPEVQSYNAFYIMMEIVLGEGLSYQYIADVKRADKSANGMITLSELRENIIETLHTHDKEVFDNPQQVYNTYQLEPQENEELRYDVIVGNTCFEGLVSQYYQGTTELFDKISQFGAQAVFIAFPFNNGDANAEKDILNFRYKLEDGLKDEILNPEGLGILLGGAIGTGSCYVDLLLFDVHAFVEKVRPFLQNYSQYSFYLSDFRQNCNLMKLS